MTKYINFLDLGAQPLANNYLKKKELNKKEVKYRLKVGIDLDSKLVSINKPLSSKMMFNDNYPYRSSMSKTMTQSFKNLAKIIKKKFKPRKMLEIGSNDGSFIKNFSKKITIGIEPCANVEKITKKRVMILIQIIGIKKLQKKFLVKKGGLISYIQLIQ